MKTFHELSTAEKIENSIFFKIGYKIGEKLGLVNNYGSLDKFYRYQADVKSEVNENGTVKTSLLWLNPEIAKFAELPEKIEIKSGAVKMKRDVFYKEKHTGNTVMTEPYEVVVGEGENMKALPHILSGFFTKQCELSK